VIASPGVANVEQAFVCRMFFGDQVADRRFDGSASLLGREGG
jgi:hypothetical protein